MGNKRGQNELKKRLELGHYRDQMEIRMRSLIDQNEVLRDVRMRLRESVTNYLIKVRSLSDARG